MKKSYSLRQKFKWVSAILFILAIFVIVVTYAAPARTTRSFAYGAWLGDVPTATNVVAFQQMTGHHLDVDEFYINWATGFDTIIPYLHVLDHNKTQALVTWETWQYNTHQISTGQADTYIHDFAVGVKHYGKTLQLRPLHEMNGNWYPWAIGDSIVNTNATFIAAWRRIVTIFRQVGATNARFVWSINATNVGAGASYTGAYPGDNYVDAVGVDGYNWGTTQPWGSTWQMFDQIFSEPYRVLTRLTLKPFLIPEWASAEMGGNKAAWIKDAFQQLSSEKYSRIVGADWFNTNKETDWRVNSSPAALSSYKAAKAAI